MGELLGFHSAGETGLMAAGSEYWKPWSCNNIQGKGESLSSPAYSSSPQGSSGTTAGVEHKRKCSPIQGTDTDEDRSGHAHGHGLLLTLGPDHTSSEAFGKNSKRNRPFSPASKYPQCQVDDCRANLSLAKDYHRRHKVCETHSKAAQALVHQIMQRFCQQCSRFHSLGLFDEGKRSCRRRLAGHNRRRRKNQPEMVAKEDHPLVPDAVQGTELLRMVTLLSQMQSAGYPKKGDKVGEYDTPSLNVLEQAGASVEGVDITQVTDIARSSSPPLTSTQGAADLQLTFAAGQGRKHGPEKISSLSESQGGLQEYQLLQRLRNTEESCMPSASLSLSRNWQDIGSSSPNTATNEEGEGEEEEEGEIQVLNLIDTVGSSTIDSGQRSKCPQPQAAMLDIDARDLYIEMQGYNRTTDSRLEQSLGMTSPPYCQARIALKLMDTDPMNLPQSAQLQLLNWIAALPSAVETYIRPGCVILTVFSCMQAWAFEEICANLPEYLDRFLKSSSGGFWNQGRITVQMGMRQVNIVDGNIMPAIGLDPKTHPRLKSVRPLATVAGKETVLTLKGQNLGKGTKIICSYRGKYTLQEVEPASGEVDEQQVDGVLLADELRIKKDVQVQKFSFKGGPREDDVGRCFIEVVDELSGDFFPVVVADAAICKELQALEQELDASREEEEERLESAGLTTTSGYGSESRAAICFLHDLGWVLQKGSAALMDSSSSSYCASLLSPSCELSCYKRLLKFAVFHDWCAVVRKLLDIIFCATDRGEILPLKVQEMLSEVNLLHQAVRRKCRPMVESLLSYVPPCEVVAMHTLFKPSAVAAGGLTALHVAACMPACEAIVDALIGDPDKVGLQVWKNAKDSLGQTPEGYALDRGFESYLKLVEVKLECERVESVNIWIGDSTQSSMQGLMSRLAQQYFKVSPPCKDCRQERLVLGPRKISGFRGGILYKPLVLSMVGIATLCVCVTLFLKSPPRIGFFQTLRWEDIGFGAD